MGAFIQTLYFMKIMEDEAVFIEEELLKEKSNLLKDVSSFI